MDQAFEKLQRRLANQPWMVEEHTDKDRTLVYIAGMSLDQEELAKVAGIEFYEERLLYVIGLLRNPKTNIVFVTSKQIDPVILQYYFQLFSRSKSERASMEQRWHHFFIGNTKRDKTLTQKVLQSQRVRKQINSKLRNPETAVLRCFNSSVDEKTLAVKLGIPLFAPNPELLHFGSKSGAREIFKAAHLRPAFGVEHITSSSQLIKGIRRIIKHHLVDRVVLKFNYSFSGVGNAILPIKKFPTTDSAAINYIQKHLQPCETQLSVRSYLKKLFEQGGIVEEWIEGEVLYSPSVQVVVHPHRRVEILSSHEQILDSETHQIYLGARFPARKLLRPDIIQQAKLIGKELANHGVIGPFGIDFIVVKRSNRLYTYPIEINLRKGGTTHPFHIARMLTEGLNGSEGSLQTKHSNPVYYYSIDNIKSPNYIGMTPKQLIALVRKSGLEFDPETNIGITLHLMGAVRKYGKFGAVCIAQSPKSAEQLYIILQRILKARTQKKIALPESDVIAVDRNRLVNTFVDLARISSPSGHEGELRLILREELVRLGVNVRVDKAGNLIGKKAGKGNVPILLSAHMDTVQPCDRVKPVVRGNMIMSDGRTILGADNKAGIAYILEVLRMVYTHSIEHKPLEIIFSTNEEQFSQGAQSVDMSKIKAPFGLVIDGAGLGEVDFTAPYIATIDVNIAGKSAHSGVEPEKGISAIQIAAHAINAVKLGRLQKDTTANIGMMTGGTNRNAIPDNVELIGEVRSLSRRKLEEQLERIHKALEDAAEKFGGLLSIDSKVVVPGYQIPKTDPHIQQVMATMRRVGITPTLRQAGGASDANIFISRGVKAIDIGTGVQKPHTVEERIYIPDMIKVTEFVLEMIRVQ